MQKYKQISYDERVLIAFLLKEEKSKSEIALKLCRSKSSISREIAKNGKLEDKNELVKQDVYVWLVLLKNSTAERINLTEELL